MQNDKQDVIYKISFCKCLNGNVMHKYLDGIGICTNCGIVKRLKV